MRDPAGVRHMRDPAGVQDTSGILPVFKTRAGSRLLLGTCGIPPVTGYMRDPASVLDMRDPASVLDMRNPAIFLLGQEYVTTLRNIASQTSLRVCFSLRYPIFIRSHPGSLPVPKRGSIGRDTLLASREAKSPPTQAISPS